ncbi:MAG TPA: hypothetical protein VKP89_07470 [Burkholderiales bacterium]|nr:hypothetical protein [Burkholderiales bacterium]
MPKLTAALALALVAGIPTGQAQSLACHLSSPRTDPGTGFTAFGSAEQVLARGGNNGPAWEWGVGTDTDAGVFTHGSLDWVAGHIYQWTRRIRLWTWQRLQPRDVEAVLKITRPSLYDASGRLIAETDPGGGLKREILYLGDMPVGVVQ